MKRIISIFVVILMLLPVLASAQEARPVLDVAFWEFGDIFSFQPGNDDPYADVVMDKANVTIIGRPVSQADYDTKINLWAATDDLPNVFLFNGTGNNTIWPWMEQGLIRSIPDDLSEYPLLDKYLHEDAIPLYQQCIQDGTYWAIPRADFVLPYTYTHGIPYMRKSDYEAMGSPALPSTVDEWYDFCMLAKETFPDKAILTNGSTGLQISNFFGDLSPDLIGSWYFYEDKGLYGPPIFSQYERSKTINRFWKAGLIDRDMFSVTDQVVFREKFIAGESLIFLFTPFPGHMNNEIQPLWDKKNPDIAIGDALMMMLRAAGDDNKNYIAPMKYWSENYISAKTTDEQMAAIFRMYEFYLSDEGFEFRRFGIEGKDYTKENGEINIIREKNAAGVFKPLSEIYPSGYFSKVWATWDEEFPFTDPSIDPGIRAFGQQYLDAKKDFAPQPDKYNVLINAISTEAKRELVINSGNEDLIKLYTADDFEAEWNAFMKKYEDLGLWEMCQEVNDLAREAGYID